MGLSTVDAFGRIWREFSYPERQKRSKPRLPARTVSRFVVRCASHKMSRAESDNPDPSLPLLDFLETLESSLVAGTFLRLTFGKYRGDEPDLQRVGARRVSLKGKDHLSFTYQYRTQDVTRNVALESGAEEIRGLLNSGFKSAHLFTSTQDLQLEFNRRGNARLSKSRPTQNTKQREDHDRPKRRLVDPGASWLRELGVTRAGGKVLPSMADKWRQINKFVEILDSSLNGSPLADKDGLQVVDFGSGKGYLTFAMHGHLRGARTLGVELREALAGKCNEAVKKSGCTGLEFKAADIGECDLPHIDIMVALHACDTATDLAIHQGISKGAGLILCAPCCHKEIRPQIRIPTELSPMLRHGIHLGAQADMLTDTMRALLLEAVGYSVKVFEFIALEHTSKNKMIAAVKNGKDSRAVEAGEEFRRLKEFYGVKTQRLEELLND